jgi:hypothetical protein
LLGDGDDTAFIDRSVQEPAVRADSFGVAVYGGDGDDTIRGSGERFLGGEGEDLLIGGPLNEDLYGEGGPPNSAAAPGDDDVLRGGGGNDKLRGGLGDDVLNGGPGDDVLAGDAASDVSPTDPDPLDADVLRGGRGLDVVTYGEGGVGPIVPLRVSFDGRTNDGRRRERDNFSRSVERAYSVRAARIALFHGELLVGRFRLKARGGLVAPGLRVYRLGRRGTTGADKGLFTGTPFDIRERRGRGVPTEIRLPKGDLGRCRGAAGARSARRRRSRREIRRLREEARGRFHTSGRHSAATVRGTTFTIIERCDGTLTKVTHGVVTVRDYRRKKTIVLTAGERYLARAPR